jgi:hypothetical protein
MYSKGFIVVLVVFIAAAIVWGEPMAAPQLSISAEARCVDTIGIPIAETRDNQVKVACLRDKGVQMQCNPDGRHARIQAFRDWSQQLMDFKERCAAVEGVFSFADPNFREPADDSFCSSAQVEVRYGAFEEPHCNFVSRCPAIALSCIRPEEVMQTVQRTVALPGVPTPVALQY